MRIKTYIILIIFYLITLLLAILITHKVTKDFITKEPEVKTEVKTIVKEVIKTDTIRIIKRAVIKDTMLIFEKKDSVERILMLDTLLSDSSFLQIRVYLPVNKFDIKLEKRCKELNRIDSIFVNKEIFVPEESMIRTKDIATFLIGLAIGIILTK